MTKSWLSIVLIIAFVLMQGLSLHGHDSASVHPQMLGHANLHIHSHVIGIDAAATESHPDEAEINVLGTPHLRDVFLDQPLLLQSLIWAIVLLVVWLSIDRPLPLPALLHPSPPERIRPSPRAPPR